MLDQVTWMFFFSYFAPGYSLELPHTKTYRIHPNYRTVYLSFFSKLLEKTVVKYLPNKGML